jgi:hypothetical protein
VTGADPLTVLPEEPQGSDLEVRRSGIGIRGVVLLTVVVSVLAAVLVVVLYMSPLAAR